ncbi:hypothetical protein NECID01_2185 [Nematocida sp. AWRm77]|nr:hypothetical protein NECID01_2185 [Nematocida sp. AWRm77]
MKTDSCTEQTERSTQILDEKIRKELGKEQSPLSEKSLWAGAFSVLEASLRNKGAYAYEAVQLLNKYSAEEVDGSTYNALRACLRKYCAGTQGKAWEDKAFCSLVLKSMCTEEAYTDSEWVDKTLELAMHISPKIRRKALPGLRRVIEHEDKETGGSSTFEKVVKKVEAMVRANLECGGKAVSILNNLHKEIAKYGMTGRMLDIVEEMQSGAKTLSIPAIKFAHALLEESTENSVRRHLIVLNMSAQKGASTTEEFTILMEYAAAVFKHSNTKAVLGTEEFLVQEEGTSTESLLRDLILGEIERNRPEKLSVEACVAVHGLLQGASVNLFPGFKKVIETLAEYCFSEKDTRVSKEIELIIGHIGVERFLKTVGEREVLFWIPMMKSAVHSADIEVFKRRILPQIEVRKAQHNKAECEALWSCFPSFCRNMEDREELIGEVLTVAREHINNPTIRGYVSQGVHRLVEDAHKTLLSFPSEKTALEKTKVLRAIGEDTELFEKIAKYFKKEPTENERVCLKSMLSVISSEWQMAYFGEIIERSFAKSEEKQASPEELRPEYDRKEKDVPEEERVFIENAHLLEIIACGLLGNKKVEEGVLRYCLSTHLRTQKMGYKVLLALIESGYNSKQLIDIFFHETSDKVMFACSRHLKLQAMYNLLKIHKLDEGELLYRVVFEMISIVRVEGGKNRKTAFDMAAEMASTYSTEKLSEVCKMALAGLSSQGKADYQTGSIVILTNLIYIGKEKVAVEILDAIFDAIYELSSKKVYSSSKAILGLLSVLLVHTPHIDRYLERSLVCIDRVIYHFKLKLHENLKSLLRRVLEKRNIADSLSYPQKELLKHKGGHHMMEEKERVFTDDSGKILIKEQVLVGRNNPRKKLKR